MSWKNFHKAIREIVEDSESLSLDNATDRETLISKLIELQPRPAKRVYPHENGCCCIECEDIYMANKENGYDEKWVSSTDGGTNNE